MRTIFLFGAGLSIPAGMPSTGQITDTILFRNNGHLPEVQDRRSNSPNWQDIICLNRWVANQLIGLSPDVLTYTNTQDIRVNYERIYSMLEKDSDPSKYQFIRKYLTEGIVEEREKERYFNQVIAHALWWIKLTVGKKLAKQPKSLAHMNFVVEACQDMTIQKVSIANLNHDGLLDLLLRDKGIEYVDGFSDVRPGMRVWNYQALRNREVRTRLFTLHGSVHWRWIPKNKLEITENIYETVIFDDVKLKPSHTDDDFSKETLIVGTENKLLEYYEGIFPFIHHEFFEELLNSNMLIVCGYSFGDNGINHRILTWLKLSKDHKIIVIHGDPDSLTNDLGEFKSRWQELRGNVIAKWIEDTSWSEIRESMKAKPVEGLGFTSGYRRFFYDSSQE